MKQFYVSLVDRNNGENEPVVKKIEAEDEESAKVEFLKALDNNEKIFLEDKDFVVKVEERNDLVEEDLPDNDEIRRPGGLDDENDIEVYARNALEEEYGHKIKSCNVEFDMKNIYISDIKWEDVSDSTWEHDDEYDADYERSWGPKEPMDYELRKESPRVFTDYQVRNMTNKHVLKKSQLVSYDEDYDIIVVDGEILDGLKIDEHVLIKWEEDGKKAYHAYKVVAPCDHLDEDSVGDTDDFHTETYFWTKKAAVEWIKEVGLRNFSIEPCKGEPEGDWHVWYNADELNTDEDDGEEYYYNYDVLCDIYYKGGVIHRDEEGYAKSYKDLCKMVREDWEYDDDLEEVEEYGNIEIKINSTNDPAFKGQSCYYSDDEVELEVPEEIAKRIRSLKDLNDFYAYAERLGDNFTYSFPESEQDRIDELVELINYTAGEYDEANAKRIYGCYFGDDGWNALVHGLPVELTIDLETMNELGINPTETDGNEIDDILSDYLSDTYGYCHYGFEYDVENDHINIYHIKWDTTE